MPVHGPCRIPERRLRLCAKAERAYRRIMSEINVPVVRVACFVVQGKALITMLEGLNELAAMPVHRPGTVMGLQHDPWIVELMRDPEKINRSLRGLIEPAPVHIEDRQIGNRWRKVGCALEPASNIGCAFDDFSRLT